MKWNELFVFKWKQGKTSHDKDKYAKQLQVEWGAKLYHE